MSSLSRVLDGSTGANGGLPSSPASASGSYYPPQADIKPKRKRPSRAAAAFIDEDDIANRRSSLRQSTRPRRYNDEVYDDDEYGTPSRGRGSAGVGANGDGGDEYLSDEEGDGLLRATAHIWREPLQAYITDLHARRRQVEQDVEDVEASRKFLVAARATEMTAQRIPAMRARREIRAVEIKQEAEIRAREEALAQQRAAQEDEKRVRKEVDKEERLRKQREAARKKREEERLKREHDNEQRRLRAEEARIAKIAEAERKAALTPEQREAEDRALADKLAREREEAAARMRAAEEELMASGRGARKRRRPTDGTGDPEEDAALALSSMYADYDELDDDDDMGEQHDASGTKGRKGKTGSRRGSSFAPEAFVLPPGAYVGPDGQYYDASGQPLAMPQAGASTHGSPHEDGDLLGEDLGGELQKQPKKPIDELERKVWMHIARKDIPKVVKVAQQSTTSRLFFAKRLSSIVAREAKRAATRTKPTKDIQTRAKRVMRELMMFMKGNEKREREARKKAEKEALDKARKEEEVREAKRQARKLNFLITQTELYSHFVGSKIKTSEAEESADTAAEAKVAEPTQPSASLAAAMAAKDVEGELRALDFDEDDEENAAIHARRNAQAAVDKARKAASAFDAAAKEQNGAALDGSQSQPNAPLDFDGDDLNFQNPDTESLVVKQPKMLACTLKEYQLKGLNWLANLYEQGINGILADEMGLGKTVQSISLMAYLAEVHNIWGPFLVISPASTLHNWQQEITRFVPGLKALPYWGNTKDRAVLRKFWNRKSIRYDKDAPFHVVVTSYQLAVADEKYFNQVKWQYMVLDEAQAIKSSSSTRWKTLLGFRCRNRLLLTGTPIQNSMHELWALLHFIMPSLFDNHDEFSEWFSKDVENSVGEKGAMNEHQLRRLHMILKPFMLRRIKKNVQNELGDKLDLYCDLTPRQKAMYRTLKENISITDLVARASSLSDDDSVKRLMNLIMQFRKVCNHPELFERADVTAPFAFAEFNQTASIIRDPEVLDVPYATHSKIEYKIPKTLYRDGGMLHVPGPDSRAGFDSFHLDRLLNIWRPDYVQQSLKENNSTFAFARGLGYSPGELYKAVSSHGVLRLGDALQRQSRTQSLLFYESSLDEDDAPAFHLHIPSKPSSLPRSSTWQSLGLTPLAEVEQNYRRTSPLTRPDARFYYDPAVAPPITAVCSDRSYAYDDAQERFDELFEVAVFGLPASSHESPAAIARFEESLPGFSPQGILGASDETQLPLPSMQVPQLQKLILDSGKLAKLDALLTQLKAEGHRCLIYFQMTRMMDLFEEYLAFRQHKYLRLDGSSTISERRDMVTDWQTKPELFLFLLSTRAGGLGINLTAADTVIFYDSDWNPSNDAQAMDRAHRLGQTKQVTVYRLITKDTVDERIVQLARNKKLVQDAVVGSSGAAAPSEGAAKANEVVSLLLNDDELEDSLRQAEERRKRLDEKKSEEGKKGAQKRELNRREKAAAAAADKPSFDLGADDEDGMSFFANVNQTAAAEDDADQPPASGSETPQAKPKAAPRKRKVELDENGQPKQKRKRRTKAEMEIFRAEEAERKRKKEEDRLARKAEKAAKGGRR
ncbi:putative DNA helicase INO80 [Rhodotorula diobovata]|uniref:Chromatin-remodeling ATPase INO80 n=1 Tax=Rhodotorula diobovata TaxID=5288 RepID=A0A5C5FZ05_9BASI|nr:putative DNA helicase INO80 [Rhodotorula diobovata]